MGSADAPAFQSARMTRPLADGGVATQASFLRKHFSLSAVSDGAILRITSLGLYRAFINGVRVGDDQLTPGWTSYQDRLSFQTYDVSALLRRGENVLDIWLGDGWYRSQMLWAQSAIYNTWGDKLAALAEIDTGAGIAVATSEDWLSGLLPILKSGIYFGEIYDARCEGLPADQGACVVTDFDPATLVMHEIGGVKELQALQPISSFKDEEQRTIYDFGQNAAGYVRIEVQGQRGTHIIIEHAEILNQGRFSNANFRSAAARVEYVLHGGGKPEVYNPTFTYQGFRYARVTVEGDALLTSIEHIPITSATEPAGSFTCGHRLVNRLVENTVWSMRSNFIEVPTDCPQRDERLGWTGDAQIFAPTSCYLNNSHAFWVKWLRDLMADQRPDGEIPHFSPDPTRGHEEKAPHFYGSTGWADAIVVVPWTLWCHYADESILAETLPSMIRWVDFVWTISDGPIVQPPRSFLERGFTFGDWLHPSGSSEKPLPSIGDDMSATYYFYVSLSLIARIAKILSKPDLEADMQKRAAVVKDAFQREFVTQSGRLVYDDQTAYALGILHDLVPAEHKKAASQYLMRAIARSGGCIGTGFIGTPALLPALVKAGESAAAASLLLQENVPGWLYQVKNGATTIWERWDAIREDGSVFDPAMNSFNHYAYGAVCQWLFEGAAGFRPDPECPGFQRIIFEPIIIPQLSPVKATHLSIAGEIAVEWELKGQMVVYAMKIPKRATGVLVLSGRYEQADLDGKRIDSVSEGAISSIELAAGEHVVTFRLQD